jgi:excisionase family DNA binding protein
MHQRSKMNIQKAAEYSGYAVQYVRRPARQGKIGAVKKGQDWRIDAEKFAAYLNKGAIQTTSKRLQTVIREQTEAGAAPRQPGLPSLGEEDDSPLPAALSFSVYRVNDYDLQVQHNEAVNLAGEHIGIQRTKTDTYFDGTLGNRLVKIVPFNHPLTLLDLQLLQDELKARPSEERDIVLVCLGKETAVDPWLDDYNKRHPVNTIEVIELRTDQKYGKFFAHQPAQAQVKIERKTSKTSKTSEVSETSEVLIVEIEDFISPTIVERLEMETPLFKAQIPDWRAMVDVVLIDTAYDGGPDGSGVFNITLSDVPERKNDLVRGRYELPAPDEPTTVAVKIIDMLGEEVLVTERV